MVKGENEPSLDALMALARITEALESSRTQQTRVMLSRTLNIDLPLFDEAMKWGCKTKFLKLAKHNYLTALKTYVVPEEAYYPSIATCLEALWKERRYEPADFYVENTSRRDSKIVGPWTRPDLTLVSKRSFPWTVGAEFDVVTFEIKRPDSANVLAVFEALSHATAATRAYVVFPIEPEAWRKANEAQERRVRDECSRHGVGLILVSRAGPQQKALLELEAVRRELDHERCSDFLDAVLSEAGKKRISAWKG